MLTQRLHDQDEKIRMAKMKQRKEKVNNTQYLRNDRRFLVSKLKESKRKEILNNMYDGLSDLYRKVFSQERLQKKDILNKTITQAMMSQKSLVSELDRKRTSKHSSRRRVKSSRTRKESNSSQRTARKIIHNYFSGNLLTSSN